MSLTWSKTFQQILDRARTRPILEVDEETVTVGQMILYLHRRSRSKIAPFA